jgi:hypothetical protein
MQRKSELQILVAYKRVQTVLTDRGRKPKLQKLDNEASQALQDFMMDNEIDYQLSPPQIHQRNAAERAIRTLKNHFISELSSTDQKNNPQPVGKNTTAGAHFAQPCERLVHQPLILCKCSTPWSIRLQLYTTCTPMQKVLLHEKTSIRETWDPHGVETLACPPSLQVLRRLDLGNQR